MNNKLLDAQKELEKRMQGIDGIRGFSSNRRNLLIVYVRDSQVGQHVPRSFKGFRVNAVETGDVTVNSC